MEDFVVSEIWEKAAMHIRALTKWFFQKEVSVLFIVLTITVLILRLLNELVLPSFFLDQQKKLDLATLIFFPADNDT